jgi:tetratricopeptide (TPR) repeat protein
MPDEQLPGEEPDELVERFERYADRINQGSFAEAEAISWDMVSHIVERAADSYEFDPDLEESVLAASLEQAGEWKQARQIYERRLSRANREDAIAMGRAYKDLAFHYAQVHELDLAARFYASSVTAIRKAEFADTILPHWLPYEADIAIRQGRYRDALSGLDEALALLSAERLSDLSRGNILTGRARCHLGLANIESAVADLTAAWKCLEPWGAAETLPGVQSSLAEWWQVQAALCEQHANFVSAAEAWGRTVALRRRVVELMDLMGERSHYSLLALADGLTSFGDYLTRHSETSRAAQCYAESDQIRASYHLAPLDRETMG